MVLDFFEKAYYINLDESEDRRIIFEKQKEKFNLDIERFPAIKIENPSELPSTTHPDTVKNPRICSCYLSHYEIIKKAKELKLKNVLVFEDDVEFADDFVEKVRLCVEDINRLNLNWDLFYITGSPNYKCIKITENISYNQRGHGIYGAYAYAMSNRFYDVMLNTPKCIAPIDVAYLHMEKEAYICRHIVAYNRDILSIVGGFFIKNHKKVLEQIYREYIW